MHTSFNVIKYPEHILELAKVASQSRPIYQETVRKLIKEDKIFCYVSKLLLGNSWKTLILKTDRYHLFDLLLSSFIHRKVQGIYLSGNIAIYSPFLENFIQQFSGMTISSSPRLKILASFLYLQSPDTLQKWSKILSKSLEGSTKKTMIIDYYLLFCFHINQSTRSNINELYESSAFTLISKFDDSLGKSFFKNLFKYSQSINETNIFTQQRV